MSSLKSHEEWACFSPLCGKQTISAFAHTAYSIHLTVINADQVCQCIAKSIALCPEHAHIKYKMQYSAYTVNHDKDSSTVFSAFVCSSLFFLWLYIK